MGPQSAEAGKASACAGCPNQRICASGEARQADPAVALVGDKLSGVKHKVVVLSGKGGVGKTTFACQLAFGLGLAGEQHKQGVGLVLSLFRAYLDKDCSLAEIDPLVVTRDGRVMALDAKLNFDDNALYRHPDFEGLRDLDEEDAAEIEAKRYDLSFITLDGNVGCMVNGAGLAMATMDTIKHFGGQPANFLDVGGGATAEKVTAAFKIITADPKVKGIFVNIFGGIMKCDTIAEGVITAVKQVGLKVPLCVRLEGTNVELGKKMLAESGLPITTANDMADGAQKIVALVKGAK